MTQVICLTSVRGRSGKDTLIEQMQQRGIVVARVAFGDVLKEQCADELASWRIHRDSLLAWFHGNEKDYLTSELAIKELPEGPYKQWLMYTADRGQDEAGWMTVPRTPRWHLQKYGTEYRRVYLDNPDVWLNEGVKEILNQAVSHDIIVVTDLRQSNEYDRMRSLQGTLQTSAHGSAKIDKVTIVRLHRMWFVPGVDDASYHVTDLDLIGHKMDAVVLNQWGHPGAMVDTLMAQGGLHV